MLDENGNGSGYHRYHIETEPAPDIKSWPSRFDVRVGKLGLAKFLIKEVFQTRGNKEVMFSRPCMYGVFSGPVGGFSPQPEHCVGCLRCMTEFPDFVRVSPNPARRSLGDSYFTSNFVDTLSYEAQTGIVPVKGAGYRGRFGGVGWDGMWTDMSEIVRPTRDGIHGREFISTVVDVGYKPGFLTFDRHGEPTGVAPQVFSIPLPFLFDVPPHSAASGTVFKILARTSADVDSLAVIPLEAVLQHELEGKHIVPLVKPGEEVHLASLSFEPRMVAMHGWDDDLFRTIQDEIPGSLVCLRLGFDASGDLLEYVSKGVHIFHLTANYHGRDGNGGFVLDLIRKAHQTFVDAGIRDEVTLIGGGGIIAAEHIPKAIISGLDAVALDTPVLVALQGEFEGECVDRESSRFLLPENLEVDWGVQRLKNLVGSWRDQLLEIMGAMGLREVRRLRGEMGRAMFVIELEEEAFAGVEGYA